MSVATLTLNPALDVSTTTPVVEHTHKVRCGPARYDPGGGGINVARVAKVLGAEVTAIFTAGGLIGQILRQRLDTLGLAQRAVPIAGSTRESFTVDELESGKQYRFVLPGPTLSRAEQQECLEQIKLLDPCPKYLVVSGSLPPGVDSVVFARDICDIADSIKALLVLDCPDLIRVAPPGRIFLVKPSARELSEIFNKAFNTRLEQAKAAFSMIRDGRAKAVVVSLGSEGAALITDGVAEHFSPFAVKARSAVGAGDSMLGGIVAALDRGWNLSDSVRYGMAAGAAAVMNPGTELCHRADVEDLFRVDPKLKEKIGSQTFDFL